MSATAVRPYWYAAEGGHTVIVEPTAGGRWHWRAIAGNGAPLARSETSHTRKDAALRAARRLHPPHPATPTS